MLEPSIVRSTRNAQLDWIRAYAVLLTVLMHYVWVAGVILLGRDVERESLLEATGFAHALAIWLFHSQHGVYLFFVLSGYLIASIVKRSDSLSPIIFLRNRALRLFPALWCTLVAMLLIGVYNGGAFPNSATIVLNFLTLNWADIRTFPPILTVTWSLFWEWAFYFVAAFALIFLRSRSISLRLFAIGILMLIPISLIVALGGRSWTYFLLFGAGVSVAWSAAFRQRISSISGYWVLCVYALAVLIYTMLAPAHHETQVSRFAGSVTPHDVFVPAFALCAAWLVSRAIVGRASEHVHAHLRPLTWIGERSYSIYLWHMPVIFFMQRQWSALLDFLGDTFRAIGVVGTLLFLFFCTLAISEISFRLLEQPYLRRQSRSRG
jgi:exopolysaccharide production protein ExoZ